MIKEIAIDPDVLIEWSQNIRDYRDFNEEYGIGTPRIISSFPKTKYKNLRKYLLRKTDQISNDIHKSRYVSMVQMLQNNIYLRCNEVDSSREWQDLVLDELEPFDIVIARESFNCDNVLTVADIIESDFLYLKHQVSFKRTKEDFLQTVRGFLRLTMSEIIIIDAYAWKPNAIKTIKAIIREVNDRKFKSKPVKVTVIYKELTHGSPAPDAKFLKKEIEKEFKSFPEGIELIIKQLKETENSDTFHNRYILNDIGGISLGHGLDISDKEHTTDEITLLTKTNYEKRWRQFARDTDFKIVSLA